ncbi:hypothetical protein [Aquibaculum arenosum]|uniref:Lipoprotein n=1 Tax=Aquibaculum arenosum TaxID=3032591 RepID=A0ABT5YLI5_9PROT|nr:hypothetical protein [Fodinicurvata sp. CAU 1616]MDF2095794.1 hypothetical protein [Fodinicurvata sp. CAU 1616]
MKLGFTILALGAALLLGACETTGEGSSASTEPSPQGAGTMTKEELLATEGMEAVSSEEVRSHFAGNTAFWEPVGGTPQLFASYYDPSGSQRQRERRATEVMAGSWHIEEERFCHQLGDNNDERCGSFVATPEGILAFCAEGGRCDWLVVGLNEGNSLEL